MPRRARWDGPTTVRVMDPENAGSPPLATVEPGHYLPDDVPAKVRDQLIHDSDLWTEIDYHPPGSKAEAKKEGD